MPIGEFRLGPNAADNGIIEEGYYGKLVGESFNIPTRYGGVCGPGSFCTAGIRADCVAGTYCEYELMSTNTDLCDAGYYCEAGTLRRRPTELSSHKGAMCLPQQFCVQGSSAGADCPVGTYSDARGLQASAQCSPCKNGFYCETPGLDKATMLTQLCYAGKYCLTGTSSSSAAPDCDFGKYCPLGS